MELRFQCSRCPAGILVDPLETGEETIACPNCKAEVSLAIGPDIRAGGPVEACCVCGSHEMYRRKDFPQRLGVLLVAAAAIASLTFYYFGMVIAAWAVLAASVVADLGLYYVLPRVTGCYKCGAIYRRAAPNPRHGEFDLAIADKYK
ncbi:MAG: hypothetical protein BIFFINMI_00164 [Phycisphaerae bacterium]|nr:hypothetical protein [Phycisphaerae bacterium]